MPPLVLDLIRLIQSERTAVVTTIGLYVDFEPFLLTL